AVGHQQRVARVGLEDGRAELDGRRLAAGEGHGDERVAAHGARVPEAGEPVPLRLLRLLDDARDRRPAPAQTDPHARDPTGAPMGTVRAPARAGDRIVAAMRITAVTPVPVTFPTEREPMSFCFVRIDTDAGVVGYGEACDSFACSYAG